MATAEASGPRGEQDGPADDIVLTAEECHQLMEGIESTFLRPEDAGRLMRQIRYPRASRPDFNAGMRQAWNQFFDDLENGILLAPYTTLLRASLRIYQDHPVLRPIAERHGVIASRPTPSVEVQVHETAQPAIPEPAPQSASTPPRGCHVIIRASNEAERQHAILQLRELDLNPHEVWSTGSAVSYRLTANDPGAVRERLEHTHLGWTVVAPGEPDYLFHSVFIEGPDARRFRVRDAPAQQTLNNLASEILTDHYQGQAGTSTPVTIDHVTRDGETRRVDADSTMHDAGVRDGDTLRVGYQANAGSVHPDEHRAALERARNQLRAFASSHPGFRVRANAGRLPTDYELSFGQPSLGPDPTGGPDPMPIEQHVVLLVLGPEFPRQAPALWWETPIFHPNVAPNYGDGLREPQLAGKVCLGLLADEWQPGRDFGDLCQLVIDMAAFRSYGLFREVVGQDGTPVIMGDFYDMRAAEWVAHNQEVIRKMGGQVKIARHHRRIEYRNVIEPA